MVDQDERVVGVHPRVLGRCAEEVVRVRGHELVERGAGGDEDRRRRPTAAACAPRLLPERRDGPRIAREHGHVQVADVHAELEGAGGHDAEHVARPKPLLHRPPPRGQVSAAVPAHDPGIARLVGDGRLDRRQEDFRGQATLGEGDRGNLPPEEARDEPRRLAEIGRPDAELRVDDGRVVAEKDPLAGGRPALRHLLHGFPDQALGQLPRVRDRRGGHDELGGRAVVRADPLQPPHDVGEVAAEDAPVGVKLVDHDVAEVLEEVQPLRVVREDPGVQHVGVGQDQVRPRPHRAPRVRRRVAVVGEHPEFRQAPGEGFQLRELVLGERLGGKEVEHAGVGRSEERLEHREVVAEGLPRGGRGDHDHVLALVDELPAPRLVRVELLDAARPERVGESPIERRGKRRGHGRTGRKAPRGGDARPGSPRGQELIENLAEHPRHSITPGPGDYTVGAGAPGAQPIGGVAEARMRGESAGRPVRVEVIAYVPTLYFH